MEVIYVNDGLPEDLLPSCVAMGFFDGFHLGHLKLVNSVINISKQNNLKKGLLTFDVSPKAYLKNEKYSYLMTLADKKNFLATQGFDYLFVIKFDKYVASYHPKMFIRDYIVNAKIKYVVCGFDFRFGCAGNGDATYLISQQGTDYQVSVIDKLEYKHHKISSTYVKKLLESGKIELVNKLLDRPYSVQGTIVHGRKNGRKIGFPTANIDAADYVLPQNGVYGVKIWVAGNEFFGMANIGFNPTFKALDKVSLEVNIFDFDGDVYGQDAQVFFLSKIRNEHKFANVDELIKQLNKDKVAILAQIKTSK